MPPFYSTSQLLLYSILEIFNFIKNLGEAIGTLSVRDRAPQWCRV